MVADVQATADVVVAAPLDFNNGPQKENVGPEVQPDVFGPTLAANLPANDQFSRRTPTPACTLEVQLGAMTSRVCQLEIAGTEDRVEPCRLFCSNPHPLVASSPAHRPSAPPKSRTVSVPSRQSARQAANPSTVPVAQRASLRIVKELGLLGPKEKMTTEVAEALLRRFDEPLTDSDIAVIAKLTCLDTDALRIVAGMTGPEGAAEEAVV